MKPFRSGRNIAIAVMVLFGLGVLLGLVALVSEFVTLDFLARVSAGLEVSLEEGEAIDSFVGTVGLFQVGVSIASLAAFLMWVYRVDSNLPTLGATYLKFTPGWAVGNFLIPLVNLYRIPQVLIEIWQASDPALPKQTDVPTRKRSKGTWLVGVWWAAFWIARFVDRLLASASRNSDTLEQITTQVYAMLASDVTNILYCALTVALVWAIDQRQRKRFESMQSGIPRLDGGVTPVAPPNTLRDFRSLETAQDETRSGLRRES